MDMRTSCRASVSVAATARYCRVAVGRLCSQRQSISRRNQHCRSAIVPPPAAAARQCPGGGGTDNGGATGGGFGCSGSDGGGGKRGPHCYGSGGDGGDGDSSRPQLPLLRRLLLATAVATVGAAMAPAPAPAAMGPAAAATAATASSTSPASTEAVPAWQYGDVAANSGRTSVPAEAGAVPGAAAAISAAGSLDGDGSSQQRTKRLLREAFSELSELRARLDAVESAAAEAAEAAEAGETLVVPLEGFAVRPYSRSLASDMRLRCRAQVSGSTDAPLQVPLAAVERAPGDADRSESSDPGVVALSDDWGCMVREAGLATAPRLRLRIQSLWGDDADADGEDRGGAVSSAAPGGGAQGQEERRRVAAHLQLATGPDGRGIELDKLLLKAEALSGLRLLLATHGSLENIGKNVNPFAAAAGLQRGLTDAMRRGHDLALLSEGGLGAAAAASWGDLSAAVGSFSSAARSENPGAASSATTTTCAQLSLHRSRRFALSAAWSSSSGGPGAGPAASLAAGGPARAAGGGEGCEGRCVQKGIVGAVQLNERVTAAAWAGDAVATTTTTTHDDGGCGPLGTWLDATQQQQQRWRQRRVGVRLSTLPDADSGQSYALCVSNRWHVAAGGGVDGGARGGLLMVEASTALPVAHGVVLTPGLVLLRRSSGGSAGAASGGGGGRTLLMAAAQTTWSF